VNGEFLHHLPFTVHHSPLITMNRKIFLAAFFFISLFSFLGFQENEATLALEKTNKQFNLDLVEIDFSVNNLLLAAENLTEKESSIATLQNAIEDTRLKYKKTEFLLAYFDPYNTKKNINGAPLPSVEPNVPEVVVNEPSGLQVLDEMIFGETVFENKNKIIELVKKFKKDFSEVRNFQSRIEMEHRHVFEAMRQELVRIFTLGVTGFDTPGSANAIAEVKKSLEGVYAALNNYMPLIEEKSRGLAIVMDARMEATLQYLDVNIDFETFDRLDFLMNHIEPQYEILLTLHGQLGIEFFEEVDTRQQAVNYHAKSIFSNDFLNAGYYANLDLNNPFIDKRIELGKILFFDPILSNNIERSCASCHQPEKAFTDGQKKSIATDRHGNVGRNSPTLLNCVFSDKYFLDIRESRLDRQMLHVVKSDKEFSTDYTEIIKKLNESKAYKSLFSDAYPDNPNYLISTYTISDALSSYVASLTSFDSPFDDYVTGRTSFIDPAVKRGFNLFMGKAACGTCHFAPVFNGTVPPSYDESESEVLGIPTTPDTMNVEMDQDLGRYASGLPRDKAEFYKTSFKTVTVRNVALTAPYMHNGVYETLEQVVDFYNRGGGVGLGLEVPHQTLPFDHLSLTQEEQADIVAFMKSLTGDMSKFDTPDKLPVFENYPTWNNRKIGGEY
jgi:cytochrome c peroxidase